MSHGDFSFYQVMKYLPRDLPDLVLDAGCGVGEAGLYLRTFPGRSFSRLRGHPRLVGYDINQENIHTLAQLSIYDELILDDLANVLDHFSQVPLTICLETLEHLKKEKGLEVLAKLIKISSRILVITPYGLTRNKAQEEEFNHVSGWVPDDFRLFGLQAIVVDPVRPLVPRVLRPLLDLATLTRTRILGGHDVRKVIALNYNPGL